MPVLSLESTLVLASGAAAATHYNVKQNPQVAAGIALGGAVLAVLARAAKRGLMGTWHKPGAVAARSFNDPVFLAELVDRTTLRMSDGALIHHTSIGDGPNQAIYVHGGPAAPLQEPKAFEAIAAEMGNDFTVHFYHQRGAGRSSRLIQDASKDLPGGSTYAKLTALDQTYGIGRTLMDLEAIRRRLVGERQQVTLIGFSFGGFIATLYAAEFPQNVRTVVNIAGAAVLAAPIPKTHSLMDRTTAVLREHPSPENDRLAKLSAGFMNQFKDIDRLLTKTEAEMVAMNQSLIEPYCAATTAHNRSSADYMKQVVVDGEKNPAGGWASMGLFFSLGMYANFHPQARFVAATIPTLVVHCGGDIQFERVTREYAAGPKAEFVVVQGISHMWFERPQAVLEVIAPWLRKKLA